MFCVSHKNGNVFFYNKNFKNEEPLSIKKQNGDDSSNPSQKPRLSTAPHPTEECNPVRKIQFGPCIITDMATSPNNQYLAVVTSSGKCHIVNMKNWKLHSTFSSYYGGFTTCSWSPDSRLLVTGGEDDLLSVFDVKRKCILLRGTGHTGFVSSVIFDAYQCDSEKYRLISVGDDTKLMLWDVDKSVCDDESDGMDIGSNNNGSTITPFAEDEAESVAGSDVPIFEPVAIHKAHNDPIRDVKAFSTGIVTVCNQGVINFWARPILEDESDYESQASQEETPNSKTN